VTNPPAPRIVAIDTMTLIWGVRKDGPEDRIAHAGYLFRELERDKAQIIVPSIVVLEYVTAIQSPGDRANVIGAISERFCVEPFDVKDVDLAARLWQQFKPALQVDQEGARTKMRADTLIVATAKNHGATEFYTEDTDCFRMASTVMVAKRLPTIPVDLFEYKP
jgi:predicted nucleic acid-binding protein